MYTPFRSLPWVDRGAASAVNAPPKRTPDAVIEEKTTPTQAALYRYVMYILIASRNFSSLRSIILRLSGDVNPLHASITHLAAAEYLTKPLDISTDSS